MTYFRTFWYLNSSCIRKSITLMFMSFSKNKFSLLSQKSVTDVSVGFRPPCWSSSRRAGQHGVSIQISISLGKTFLRISRIRNIPLTWILARVIVYVPPFISQILDFIYRTVLIFILIYFQWRDTDNQQFLLWTSVEAHHKSQQIKSQSKQITRFVLAGSKSAVHAFLMSRRTS